jgi:hypothetical protein
MAGYDGFSKSNNALAAERDGKMTAGRLAKAWHTTAAVIKQVFKTREYHHTSSWFNCTDYYDKPEFADAAEFCALVHRVRVLTVEAKRQARTFIARRVKWLEWIGTRSHPRAIEEMRENVKVTIKGQFAILHGCGIAGKDLRKKITGREFSIEEPPVVLAGTAAQV